MAALAVSLTSGDHVYSLSSMSITERIRVRLEKFVSPDHYVSSEQIMEQLVTYTDDEKALILEDLERLFESTFKDVPHGKHFVVTAGGPGAGKTTFLENWLRGHAGFVYVDPDRTCLPKMRGYCEDCSRKGVSEAYSKWRYGSTFIALAFVAYAFKEGYSLAYGSTMTSPAAKKVLNAAKTVFDNVTLQCIAASDDIRERSVKARESSGVVQVSSKDFVDKGIAFFDRLRDYAESIADIEFYLRTSFEETKLAAKREKGALSIVDGEVWERMRSLHNSVKGEGDFERVFS